MNIQAVSENCIRIYVSADDAVKLEISFASFSAGDEKTLDFLSCALAVLRKECPLAGFGNEISVEVYEQEDEGLVIYLFREETTAALACADSTEFYYAASKLYESLGKNLDTALLYRLDGGWALIFAAKGESLCDERELITDNIKIAKIREYGNLISDSPKNLFT